MNKKEKVIIFGAGKYGEIAAMTIGFEKDILFFIDNDSEKWGKIKAGLFIKPVEEAKRYCDGNRDIQIVIAMAHYAPAVLQLEHMGLHNYIYYEDVYGYGYLCKSRSIMDQEISDEKVKDGWMNHVRQPYDHWHMDNYVPLKGKVLDVGCGCGRQMFHWLCRGYDAYGIDCCDWKLEFCRQKIEDFSFPEKWKERFIYGVGEELPFRDKTFDLVTSWYVLEHVSDWKKCIKEMLRIVKPGGAAFINAPDYRNSFEEHYKIEFGHSLIDNKDKFERFLQSKRSDLTIFNELNFITASDIMTEIHSNIEKLNRNFEIINAEDKYPESMVKRENGRLSCRHRIDLVIRAL